MLALGKAGLEAAGGRQLRTPDAVHPPLDALTKQGVGPKMGITTPAASAQGAKPPQGGFCI